MQLVIILALVASAMAAPASLQPSQTNNVTVWRYNNENDGLGNYRFAYDLSDRTQHEESGTVKNPGAENQYIEVKGRYSWVDLDGIMYTVTYTADENGYHPEIHISKGSSGGLYSGPLPAGLLASLVG